MTGAAFIEVVDVFHQGGDGGVELALVEVGCDFFDRFMARCDSLL